MAIYPTTRVDLTTFTGGLVTSLDSLISADFTLNSLIIIQPGGPGNSVVYQQIIITADPEVFGVVTRPPDYASTGRQWVSVG